MRYYVKVNQELEGWDVLERDGIESDEGYIDAVVATFYDPEEVNRFVNWRNLLEQ